jgi:hypothetical protein
MNPAATDPPDSAVAVVKASNFKGTSTGIPHPPKCFCRYLHSMEMGKLLLHHFGEKSSGYVPGRNAGSISEKYYARSENARGEWKS